MANNYKDDYSRMYSGEANTAADATFGDSYMTQETDGEDTKVVRRPIVIHQLNPDPFPENTSNPKEDPDFPENPRNGTSFLDESKRVFLQQRVDEADAEIAGMSVEDYQKTKSKEKDMEEER